MANTDAELLMQFVQERSDLAFEQLVERHTPLVFSICRRKLSDEQRAEDATQLVFLALFRNADELEPGPLDGYLAKTAIYICSDMAKRCAVRRKHEQLLPAELFPVAKCDTSDDRLDALRGALAQLRDTYREVVTLRYIDRLSVEGVALALDISPQTAKKRLVRALGHLRERLKAQGFSVSLSVAAGLLRKLWQPPPSGLAARIVSAVLRGPPVLTPPRRLLRARRPVPQVVVGVGGVAIFAWAFAKVLMPRVQRAVSPVASVPQPNTTRPVDVESLTIRQRLGRKVPGLDDATPFEGSLWALSHVSGIPIEARWDEIEAEGVSRTKPIVVSLRNMTAQEELEAILAAAAPSGKLRYVIFDDRIVVRSRSDGVTAAGE